YANSLIAWATTKNRERNPRMAKMFEVKTMNGSLVIAKIAGMESSAKTTSADSTSTSDSSRGVASRFPFSTVKKRPSSSRDVEGRTRRATFHTTLSSGCGSLPHERKNLIQVKMRNAPKMKTSQ